MPLYFVAILPPEAIRDEIKLIKLDIAKEFGARHALKLPAHITLQKPLKIEENNEEELFTCLGTFAEKQSVFDLNLKNFGCFPPRVIFVDVENKETVIKLFEELQKTLVKNQFIFEAEKNFHPHLTLATRDLAKNVFPKAWSAFKNKNYYSSFQVEKISLLKHNGKQWEITSNFQLQQ